MLVYTCKQKRKEENQYGYNSTERKINKSARKEKILNICKKVLIWTGIIVGGAVLLVALYQISQVLFVGAILLIAWLGPVFPRRWR